MTEWVERYRGLILVVLVALIGLGGGLFLYRQGQGNPPLEIVMPTATPLPQLKVYITGAVRQPGVYSLRSGDRVEEAVYAAGGPTENADLARINLAQRVRDEQHIHIPSQGEEPIPQTTSGSPLQPGKVNINTAPQAILESLPDIGPVKAQRIVAYREENGPFESIEEITKVSGIGPATFEAIKPFIAVN